MYTDGDGNGSQDVFSGESGLVGWTVTLMDGNGQAIGSTTTDGDGVYSFTELHDGFYTVCVANPGGYTETQPSSGGCYVNFELSGQFGMMFPGNFGFMPQ